MYQGNKSGAGANLISALKVSSTSDHERRFTKIIAGWLGEMACQQKDFQPIIPDSQGEVSSNGLNYRVV